MGEGIDSRTAVWLSIARGTDNVELNQARCAAWGEMSNAKERKDAQRMCCCFNNLDHRVFGPLREPSVSFPPLYLAEPVLHRTLRKYIVCLTGYFFRKPEEMELDWVCNETD